MSNHDQNENSPEAIKPRESSRMDTAESIALKNTNSVGESSRWESDVEKTVQLGEQFVGVLGGVVDLARMETLLAVRTVPKFIVLWLLIVPIVFLAWCAFSTLMSWAIFSVSEQIGLALLTFLLLQIVLLLICWWTFERFKKHMSFQYTRSHIASIMQGVKDEFNAVDKTKE